MSVAIEVDGLLTRADEKRASDVHLSVGVPPVIRIDGDLIREKGDPLTPSDTERIARYMLGDRWDEFEEKGEVDFSYAVESMGRYRVNVYRQRGSISVAARVIPKEVPSLSELGLPSVLYELARKPQGLIIVTGPTGSGKSTSLAAMVRLINEERACHIVTLEDPIEYLHSHGFSVIDQREVRSDTRTFADGLRAALRQDPDVILVGEMRDVETMETALRAAETGHLVMTTLHTRRAPEVVDRIVNSFSGSHQGQIRHQLAETLQGVIAQRLLPRPGGGRVAAMEILMGTPAVWNMIREGKSHQLPGVMQTGSRFGMLTLKDHVEDLYERGIIERHVLDDVIKELTIDASRTKDEVKYGREVGF